MFSDFPGAALRFKMPKPPPKLRDSWGFSRSDPVWRSFQVLSPLCQHATGSAQMPKPPTAAERPHSARSDQEMRRRFHFPVALSSPIDHRPALSVVVKIKNMQQGGLIARWDRAFVRMKALLDLYRDVVLITKDSKPFPFVSSSF